MYALLDFVTLLLTDNIHLAPLLAFLAGVIASFTPCCLSSIPLVIGYVGGLGQRNTKNAFLLSLSFAIGSGVTFILFGIIASLLGSFFNTHAHWWYLVLGALMVAMALQTWGVVNIIPSSHLQIKNPKKGHLGAFIAGIIAGVFASPCSTPIILTLILIAADKGNILYGSLLFLLYAIGHGILPVMAGTSTGFVQRISESSRYSSFSKLLKFLMGLVILLIGFYMFFLGF